MFPCSGALLGLLPVNLACWSLGLLTTDYKVMQKIYTSLGSQKPIASAERFSAGSQPAQKLFPVFLSMGLVGADAHTIHGGTAWATALRLLFCINKSHGGVILVLPTAQQLLSMCPCSLSVLAFSSAQPAGLIFAQRFQILTAVSGLRTV